MLMSTWIRCLIKKSPMMHELEVALNGVDGPRDLWASKREVDLRGSELDAKNPLEGRLRVRLVDQTQDKLLIELPGDVMNGTRLVWVSRSEAA